MTEADLLMYHRELVNFTVQLLFGWFTVTFGLYSLAYLVGDRLRLSAVLFVLLTYILLTYAMISILMGNAEFIQAVYEALVDLQTNGTQVSIVSQRLMQEFSGELSLWGIISQIAVLLLVPIGGIGYLIYRHREGRKKVSESATEQPIQ